MALAMALAITTITLLSCGLLWWQHGWLPRPVSTVAPAIDHQFAVTFIICGILFAAAQLGLACLVWRYRERGPKSIAIHPLARGRFEKASCVAVALLSCAKRRNPAGSPAD
jgi:heme/copper-type cytochrome/quinol oxidase subunit 2